MQTRETRHAFFVPRAGLLLRILAASGGGYALCWALFSLLCAWLPFERATVWYLTGQLAPLPFACALLWAFAAATPGRALFWPLAGALLLSLPGWLQ